MCTFHCYVQLFFMALYVSPLYVYLSLYMERIILFCIETLFYLHRLVCN